MRLLDLGIAIGRLQHRVKLPRLEADSGIRIEMDPAIPKNEIRVNFGDSYETIIIEGRDELPSNDG